LILYTPAREQLDFYPWHAAANLRHTNSVCCSSTLEVPLRSNTTRLFLAALREMYIYNKYRTDRNRDETFLRNIRHNERGRKMNEERVSQFITILRPDDLFWGATGKLQMGDF
jgi:hypothetical protein